VFFAGDFAAALGLRAAGRTVPASSATGSASPVFCARPVPWALWAAGAFASAEPAEGRFGARVVRVVVVGRTVPGDFAGAPAVAAVPALASDSEDSERVPGAPGLPAPSPLPGSFLREAFLLDSPGCAALDAFVSDTSDSWPESAVAGRADAPLRGPRGALDARAVLASVVGPSTDSSAPDAPPSLPARELRAALPAEPPPDTAVRRADPAEDLAFAAGRAVDFGATLAAAEAASSAVSALSRAAASAAVEAALFSGGVEAEGGVEVTPLRYQAGLLFGGTHRRLRENSD
jgi:hypothetical protein